jgi:hypothetical protein
MRTLFGCLAGLLCVVSVALAARYGYKGADTEIDGLISATVFGLIALCACLFDAAAVRLWFMKHHAGSVIIGMIAAAALIVTFTNSLGAIAGRADSTQAERVRAKADQAEDRAELARITGERGALKFTPTTDDAVKAARDAVATAERIWVAECGNGDPRQRGPNCRQRETEEQSKRDALASVLANKALTERAVQLDADAARVRANLAKAPRVQNANPLGAVLEQMIGATAAALTAWQQAIVAGVFELCLVGVMVIYELLGHAKQPIEGRVVDREARGSDDDVGLGPDIPQLPKPLTPRPRRKAATASSKTKVGSVKAFVLDSVFPGEGECTEMKTLIQGYRAWCTKHDHSPLALREFLDEIEKICRHIGVEIKVGGDQRVYCLGVKLGSAMAVTGAVLNQTDALLDLGQLA